MTIATISSRINNFEKTLTFLIVPEISQAVPDQPINRNLIAIPPNIQLADPNFHQPAPIDLLLGAGTTLSLLSIGQLHIHTSQHQELFLQKTLLGWVIGGAAPSVKLPTRSICHVTSNLQFDLTKFWEVEQCPTIHKYTPEEE